MAERSVTSADTGPVQCPICLKYFTNVEINGHLDKCLLSGGTDPTSGASAAEDTKPPPGKRSWTDAVSTQHSVGKNKEESTTATQSSVFSMFHTNRENVLAPSEGNVLFTSIQSPVNKRLKRGPETSVSVAPSAAVSETDASSKSLFTFSKPLADTMRPTTLEEYYGQTKVVGHETLIRSLLNSQEVPSLILWGPPGCGKTTLAHIISSSSKKNGTARFVVLSATSASINDVREVIKQAQNEARLCKRKTILFIDEIHRFNKLQQDTFLPHVERGTITLIGATTENPSFQVNAALLSRCRVLALEKLSVEAMGSILNRALATLGIRVQEQEPANSKDQTQTAEHGPKIFIEQKALDTIAYLCDGDARVGLNSLQLSVQAQMSSCQPNNSTILITEEHIKEGLQRSHILYDKAGEEHYNCISALHKSMRGSHENASLYWLGRMLEGGEDPLYVARRLVRFASEDVGLADPCALSQAVSTFQACHFIGMPECEVILAQCVVYLAQAPKSVQVYQAYNNVKTCLRTHKGPLPPVPLHLRNAPTTLMKQLGYAKGYKYNPDFSEPVEQEYLPSELQGVDFFTWTPT
ncbi:ATPase WRNIP1 isoform X1 [Gouania willdenowi]|uniref:UBZ4-type domain-containing protein n=1 Tax=Gouania willdenowi TaxID=441366 RepID=A0A8C5E1Y1_GOUWI|nr:ATPase WRNIP1 isoform X1 [Gouania willdenowi]